jgi:predicted flap endonuclease-1-like 5' DNA nuclease
MTSIIKVEGIGPVYAQQLLAAGIRTTEALLAKGGTPKGRQEIAEKTGIGESLILRWVNHVDLFRVKGVAGQYSELLEAAGVDTVVELAQRDANNLFKTLVASNQEHKRVRKLPALKQVKAWVKHAKRLHRAVEY